MALLSNSASFAVGAASLDFEETVIVVLPPAPSSLGKGRLIHPTLGTLDYEYPPTDWDNINGDVIVKPVWSSSKTLLGSSNTLHAGDIRDVTCFEQWTSERGQLRMPMGQFQTLLAMYTNPPDPNPAGPQIEWYPDYTSSLGYKVSLTDLTVGGQGIRFNWLSHANEYLEDAQGWIADNDVVLSIKIIGRVV